MVGINNIMVSVAGGAPSIATAKYAIYLAKLLGAKLIVAYVMDKKVLGDLVNRGVFLEVEALEYTRELQQQGKIILERIVAMAEKKGVATQGVFLEGIVHEQIVAKAREIDVDLMVIGELKELSSRKDIFYDEGERIFRESPCPVLVVKNSQEAERRYKES